MAAATGKDAVTPAPHPLEFRRRAVELARLGEQPIAVVANQLSISESCLRNWMAQADADEADGPEGWLTTGEKKELDDRGPGETGELGPAHRRSR